MNQESIHRHLEAFDVYYSYFCLDDGRNLAYVLGWVRVGFDTWYFCGGWKLGTLMLSVTLLLFRLIRCNFDFSYQMSLRFLME